MPRPIVVKFGGAALGDLARVLDRVRSVREGGSPLVLVVSARAGVTDLLGEFLSSPRARARHERVLRTIARMHPDLGADGRARLRRIGSIGRHLEGGAAVTPGLRDRLLSEGERIAVRWLAQRLTEAGVPSTAVDADALGLQVDPTSGVPTLRMRESRTGVRRTLGEILAAGRVPVVTGYFGRGPRGGPTTLGRGGSDYSASGIAALLDAERVELVKRAVSVRTADPGEVPNAPPLSALSYEEAEELAQFGARVLHPLTIAPARAAGIPIWVRSLADPFAVTVIGAASGRRHRAFTRLGPFVMLRVGVPGGRERPGVLARVGTTLDRSGVAAVALFSSSAALSLVVDSRQATTALFGLRRIPGASVERIGSAGVVTLVGDGVIADLPRVPRTVVEAAWGLLATPRSLSVIVPWARSGGTLRALHEALLAPSGPAEPAPPVVPTRDPRRRES